MRKKSTLTLSRRLAKPRGQQMLVTAVFLFLPMTLLLVFTYIPFAKMFQFSMYEMRYIGKRVFVGLQNYAEVFQRPELFHSLTLSVYYLLASFFQLGIALLFASILSFKLRGGNVFKGIIFFPYLVSGIAIGFIFKFFFTRGFVLDSLLTFLGFSQDSLPYWLRTPVVNNTVLAATSVWRYAGQNMVLFIGAIMSVDSELYEAADIDGANAWSRFRYIILPSIKTIVVLNMILSISGSISAFEPPYVITNGTFGTGTYFVVMNSMAHEKQKVGLAAAMAIVLMALIVLITTFQKVFTLVFLEEDKNGLTFSQRRKAKKRAVQKGGAPR
ncbi:MAG: sugar ABC transporter permease [Clostridium sp.]|jgi:multiple sugar transport system permease protein|nr:sugar ABC transporter permease [Clostridium sp.]